MATIRIYLGIDSHSNLAISLEPASEGVFFLAVSAGARGHDVCKFVISEEALQDVVHNHPLVVKGKAGQLEIHAGGDEVMFHFRSGEDADASSCALSTQSFLKVLKLARNRAYAM